MVEMTQKELKSLIFKMNNDLKIYEVKKSIHNLVEKFNDLDEKFSKEIEILKKMEILEMKTKNKKNPKLKHHP
jgi:TPP-dependent 2-oxoacid decarboxylase